MRYKIILSIALLFGIVAVIASQFATPCIIGADGYLHIRMAQFLRQLGPQYNFHWARYSTFAQNFADKDFLYHAFLIPFSFLRDIFLGAKLAACLAALFLYLVFFWALRRYCRSGLIPAFLILFCLSPGFLRGIGEPRPLTFVLALTILFTHCLIVKNLSGLFVVTIIYSLTHVSSPYLLLFALLAEAVRFAAEEEFAWRSVLCVGLGLLVGLFVHPSFPHNLRVFWINGVMVPVFSLKWGMELGAEFFPESTREVALGYPAMLAAVLVMLALSTSRGSAARLSTRIWMALAGFFFAFSFFSRRYLLHAYPMVLLASAAYLTDWWESEERLALLRRVRQIALAAAALGIGAVCLLAAHTWKGFRNLAFAETVYGRHYQSVGKWLAENVPAGEIIFHTNWSDSQYLIGIDPSHDYFVTLDPTYMYYWNPVRYKLYRDISFGSVADPYTALKDEFGVRFGYAGKNYFSGLIKQIRSDSRFQVLAEDGLGVVFKLND